MTPDDKGGNGHGEIPVQILERQFPEFPPMPPRFPRRRSVVVPLILFGLTVISTLCLGVEFARSFDLGQPPFATSEDYFATIFYPLQHPHALLLGIPFSFTLLAILLAHEFGHFFACKFYGIDATYPYFIPAPNPVFTFGAFIRIRSLFNTRRSLFDVGIAGPIAGFVVAVPAMAYGVATAKVLPDLQTNAVFIFGNPPLIRLFNSIFHPGVDAAYLLLGPVGQAAWVGLFVTALNLLPLWQLDGGHILYSLTSEYHRRISILLSVGLIAMGRLNPVWYVWGGVTLVLALRFRHPPTIDRWQPLTPSRRLWAVGAALIFILSFTPTPVTNAEQVFGPSRGGSQARLLGSTSTITAVSGISFDAQKSTQPARARDNADRCGDFSTNWKRYSCLSLASGAAAGPRIFTPRFSNGVKYAASARDHRIAFSIFRSRTRTLASAANGG
jgi:Zn-dependent protease